MTGHLLYTEEDVERAIINALLAADSTFGHEAEEVGPWYTDRASAIRSALSGAGFLVPPGSEVREEFVVEGVDEEGGAWISYPKSMKQAEHALASFGGQLGVRRVITTPATPWSPSVPDTEEGT